MKKLRLFLLMMVVHASFAQTGSFMYNGVMRDYILHVPAIYTGATPVPLILNLHGLTSNASQQKFYSDFDKVADTANFILVYPNGIANEWNSGFNVPYNSGTDDVGFLSALIDTISSNYNINPARVYSTGMSNGGYMSYRLACELDNKIAAIASVTGSMTPGQVQNCVATRKVPVMQVHGTADPTVPYAGASWTLSMDSLTSYWVNRNGCSSSAIVTPVPNTNTTDGCTATRYDYDVCSQNSQVLFYKITDGEHTWPGAPITIGVTNQDFKASGEIWKFFYQHQHESLATFVNSIKQEFTIQVYPNPSDGKFELRISNFEISNFEIYNVLGEIVQHSTFNNQHSKWIDISSQPTGIYFLHIKTGDRVEVVKIVRS